MVTTGTDLAWEEATALGSYFGGLAGFLRQGPDGFERGAIAGAAEMADGHIFDDNDLFRITQALGNDASAAVVLLEHTWLRPLHDAIARGRRGRAHERVGASRGGPQPRRGESRPLRVLHTGGGDAPFGHRPVRLAKRAIVD